MKTIGKNKANSIELNNIGLAVLGYWQANVNKKTVMFLQYFNIYYLITLYTCIFGSFTKYKSFWSIYFFFIIHIQVKDLFNVTRIDPTQTFWHTITPYYLSKHIDSNIPFSSL